MHAPEKPNDEALLEAFTGEVATLLDEARRQASRSINAILTATYWEIGRRIVEFEQQGAARARYGERLIERLSARLTKHFGRGFGIVNLTLMRRFYLEWSPPPILQTVSEELDLLELAKAFPLSWSHYVRLLSVDNLDARRFYETEARRGGWSLRQLNRQIDSLFYERTALSKNKVAMLTMGRQAAQKMPSPSKKRSKTHMFWSFWACATNTPRTNSKPR
jgi:hypothetical protein